MSIEYRNVDRNVWTVSRRLQYHRITRDVKLHRWHNQIRPQLRTNTAFFSQTKHSLKIFAMSNKRRTSRILLCHSLSTVQCISNWMRNGELTQVSQFRSGEISSLARAHFILLDPLQIHAELFDIFRTFVLMAKMKFYFHFIARHTESIRKEKYFV